MLLSLFTPTHEPKWLPETYNSLLRQSYQDWQWVIVPNGTCGPIAEHIRADPRVKLVQGGEHLTNVGALKRLACDKCDGSAFIEMDHDDLLMPGETLRVIANKIAGGAGFVFSDVAVFHDPGYASHIYGIPYGWESYPFKHYGRKLQASRCFEITPRSLSEIFYCPDHVRVWGRKAYYDANGHDKNLSVCDDHDLMCKTYLAGHRFEHTGGCHYLYRMHQTNTVIARNDKIASQNRINCKTYTPKLIREWCRRESHEILNMKTLLQEGWKWGRDLYNGIGGPYGLIIVDDVLQFCPKHLVAEFMNQCFDSLTAGGYMEVRIPTTDGRAAFLDPLAENHMNASTFLNYTRSFFARKNADIRCQFQLVQAYNDFPDDFHKEHDLAYATIHLAAPKGQRWPGLKHI